MTKKKTKKKVVKPIKNKKLTQKEIDEAHKQALKNLIMSSDK